MINKDKKEKEFSFNGKEKDWEELTEEEKKIAVQGATQTVAKIMNRFNLNWVYVQIEMDNLKNNEPKISQEKNDKQRFH